MELLGEILGSVQERPLSFRLKKIRELQGFTQKAFAEKVGLSQSTIAQIETERKEPSISTLKKIAEALDVHMTTFFTSSSVHVFDLKKLRSQYDQIDKLPPTTFKAIHQIVEYAKEIQLIK